MTSRTHDQLWVSLQAPILGSMHRADFKIWRLTGGPAAHAYPAASEYLLDIP